MRDILGVRGSLGWFECLVRLWVLGEYFTYLRLWRRSVEFLP